MRKLWLVGKHEYLHMVRRRSFLISTLAIPLIIAVVMGITIAVFALNQDQRPVGYVDMAGVLAPRAGPVLGRAGRAVELRAYADEDAARAALSRGEVQAYVVLRADYMETGAVEMVYWDEPPADAVWSQLNDVLRANLAADLAAEVQQRAVDGVSLTVRSVDGSREIGSDDFMAFVIPFAAAVFFLIAVMSSAGYLLQAVTTEKENRTMEIMITSVSPEQLIAGKAAGLMGVSLTQLGIWMLTVVLGLIAGAQFFEPLRNARVPWEALAITALYFLPAYALVAGVMTAIGSAVTEARQGQQVAGLVNLMFSAPFFFLALIMANPNNPILVALTLFPTTAFITITMRWSLGVVPMWQMVLSWVLLVVSAGLSVWASARVLRAGMLRYGQRLDFRGVLRAVLG